jgi:hypothetical protein
VSRVDSQELRDAHRWLDELTSSPNLNIKSLAARESKTERWIRRTVSLAFLCPALVKAAIDGRLPRGFGVKRLMDLPMAWPDQWSALGLSPRRASWLSAHCILASRASCSSMNLSRSLAPPRGRRSLRDGLCSPRRHLHVHRPAKRQAWLADADSAAASRYPYLVETSVASVVGEGSIAIAFVHQYLASDSSA